MRCEQCGITLRGKESFCPLCESPLTGAADGRRPAFPAIQAKTPRLRMILSLFAFASIAAAAICLAVNMVLPGNGWWFLFVFAGIGSFWVTLILIIRQRKNLPKSILWQVGVISLLAFVWDWFTGYHGWSLDYVFPILCSCALAAISIIARISKLNLQDYILYLILDCALGIVTFLLIVTKTVRVMIPSAICFCMSIIVIGAMIVFQRQLLWAEIQRRLHL